MGVPMRRRLPALTVAVAALMACLGCTAPSPTAASPTAVSATAAPPTESAPSASASLEPRLAQACGEAQKVINDATAPLTAPLAAAVAAGEPTPRPRRLA